MDDPWRPARYWIGGALLGLLVAWLGTWLASAPIVAGVVAGVAVGEIVRRRGGVDAVLRDLGSATLEVDVPVWGIGRIQWADRRVDRRIAWAIYVEMSTRVATRPLVRAGSLRAAYDSLYELLQFTRQLVREAGADASFERGSAAWLGVELLNKGLAPFLARWHHRLGDWEAKRPDDQGVRAHEEAWADKDEAWRELEAVQGELRSFAEQLRVLATSTAAGR